MLGDTKVDFLDSRLESFKLKQQSTQNDLQNILSEYGQLLENYKALHKVNDDQVKQNSYVLVLVDGDGYIFNDELIREKEEGGMRAARMLDDAVEKYIKRNVHNAAMSRIVVRIYANFTSLSKQLAKSKLTGFERRSMASFAAGFTRAIGSFDFVDALDEEGTRFKIREHFKVASEDSACSHILLAACHDNAYTAQIVPMTGARDKVTLVQASGWLSDFHQFKLNVTQFPTIFRWSELRETEPSSKATSEAPKPQPVKIEKRPTPETLSRVRDLDSWRDKPVNSLSSWRNRTVSPSGSALLIDISNERDDDVRTDVGTETSQNTEQICKYFKKGFCNRGDKCTFEHDPSTRNGKPPSSSAVKMDRSRVSSYLPASTPPGFITVNKDFQRLDDYARPPSQGEYALYNKRFQQQKPCNNYHLKQICTVVDCKFDHTPLGPEVKRVLEYVLKSNPCPRKSDCRASNCYYGHICQKDGCYGQSKGCKMKANMHEIDPKVVSIVPADEVDEPVSDFTSQVGNYANETANDGTQMTEDGTQSSSAPTWGLPPPDESDYLW